MQNVRLRLDAWREAERRRDSLALGSPEWLEAEADCRSAAKHFHAEVAQVTARYAEAELRDRSSWWVLRDRRSADRGMAGAGASPAQRL